MRNRGFTLVELAIVLVIIGLLIGGILAAQSMIQTAKASAQVKQIQEFDAAVANFITKYNSPPGDARGVYTSAEAALVYPTNTAGDGYILDSNGDLSGNLPYNVWYNTSAEGCYFWAHLNRGVSFTQNSASFQCNAASGFDITSSTIRNSPAAAIAPKTGVLAASFTMYYYAPTITMTGYMLADFSSIVTPGTTIQYNSRPSIPSSAALAIDTKMDDGLPLSGAVRALGAGAPYSAAMTPMGNGWLPATCATTTRYLTQNSTDCAMVVQIMSQSGGMAIKATQY